MDCIARVCDTVNKYSIWFISMPLTIAASAAVFAHPSIWRADQLGGAAACCVSSQFAALDRELPGAGWPLSNLIELLPLRHGIGEIRLILPVLVRLSQEARSIMMVAPPAIPYPPALVKHGVMLERLIVVQGGQRADRLWTIEQVLKSASLGAMVAWSPEEHHVLQADHLRRLQLAAQASRTLTFVFRPATAQAASSPAPLRIALAPAAPDRLALNIFKRRGPPPVAPIVIDLPATTPVSRLRFPLQVTKTLLQQPVPSA